jgi:hypothetical protein
VLLPSRSLLYGPCSVVESVALDPLPQMVADGCVELVRLNRGRFVRRVMNGRSGPESRGRPRDVGAPTRGDPRMGFSERHMIGAHATPPADPREPVKGCGVVDASHAVLAADAKGL